jgi:hypothetical protein
VGAVSEEKIFKKSTNQKQELPVFVVVGFFYLTLPKKM